MILGEPDSMELFTLELVSTLNKSTNKVRNDIIESIAIEGQKKRSIVKYARATKLQSSGKWARIRGP